MKDFAGVLSAIGLSMLSICFAHICSEFKYAVVFLVGISLYTIGWKLKD